MTNQTFSNYHCCFDENTNSIKTTTHTIYIIPFPIKLKDGFQYRIHLKYYHKSKMIVKRYIACCSEIFVSIASFCAVSFC